MFNSMMSLIVFVFFSTIFPTNANIYSIENTDVSTNAIDKIIENTSILKCRLSCQKSSSCKEVAYEEELSSSNINTTI